MRLSFGIGRSDSPAYSGTAFRVSTFELELQQPLRIAAQDHPALYAGEIDLIKKLYRSIIAHGKAVVAANHYALGPHFLDYEFHNRFRVGDCVVRKTLEISARSVRQMLQLVPHFPALIDAPN